MEVKKFFEKKRKELGIKNNDNKNNTSIKFYGSSYKNILLITLNEELCLKGNFNKLENKFIFGNINENSGNIINTMGYLNNNQLKFKEFEFNFNCIYCITQNNNEVYYSDYSLIEASKKNSNLFKVLPGVIQKKKIKNISCSKEKTLFLTYGGMVYSSSDNMKENQKLLIDLLEYNIEHISAGENHFLCSGKKRNSPETSDSLFAWGDNTYCQCGVDTNQKIINNPKIIIKNISIKEISLGRNHSILLTNFGELIMFGDNSYNQCSLEKAPVIKISNDNNSIQDVKEILIFIEYFNKSGENIYKIEAKGDSTLIISNKRSLIFMGKIFNKNEKIYKLTKEIRDKIAYYFNEEYFIVCNDYNFSLYTEVQNNRNNKLESNINSYDNSNNNLYYPLDGKYKKNTSANKLNLEEKKAQQKFKTFSMNKELTFEQLKEEQDKTLVTSTDFSEDSLNELRSYINLLGISFSSSFNSNNLSFRPSNLPPKTKKEEELHRQLVYENRKMYMDLVKQKKESEKTHLQNIEARKQKEEKRARFWIKEILPNWSYIKSNKNIKNYFYEGIPSSIRGKVWMLCIGNKFSITKDYYDIEAKKSIQLLIKSKTKKEYPEDLDEKEGYNLSSLSNNTKKLYSFYIKKTFDKEKSINLIDLDIERTFPYLGVFKKESQLGESLREILRVFVVTRPDIGYVQGLSYIAGTLLLQMDTFQTFICFMNIILSPNILPFYRLDEKNIRKRLELFNDIFKCNLPDLFYHFQKMEVLPEHYLLEWLMTLFTRSIHIDIAVRIWDVYMIEGIIALYKSAIVIFSYHEKEFLRMDFSEILNCLKNLDEKRYEEDKFIEAMTNVKFTDKIMNKVNQLNEDYLPID